MVWTKGIVVMKIKSKIDRILKNDNIAGASQEIADWIEKEFVRRDKILNEGEIVNIINKCLDIDVLSEIPEVAQALVKAQKEKEGLWR